MGFLAPFILAALAASFLSWLYTFHRPGSPPTPYPVSGLLNKLRFTFGRAPSILRDMYLAHPGKTFHIRTLRGRTQVYITDPAVLLELQQLPESTASFSAWTRATLHRDYTMNGHDEYVLKHPAGRLAMFRFIKGVLTKGLGEVKWVGRGEVEKEVMEAQDWAVERVVPEVVRVFAGEECMRDKRFCNACRDYTDAIVAGGILSLVPGHVLKW
jgi:hypothetical protein